MRWMRPVVLAVLVSLGLAGCAGMDKMDWDGVLGGGNVLDEETVARGLKQALEVGTGRAVGQVGAVDGYLGNALLRIVLPTELQDIAGQLRSFGLDAKVDELEVAMNRAAEAAADEAVPLFANAIRGMTLQDAWGILNGPETAATDYFHGRTATVLTTRYRPVVEQHLRQVGGYTDYENLVARIDAIPLIETPNLDLIGHVTTHALNGLFTVLADEERLIRADPAARTTELLRRVFAAATPKTAATTN